MMGLTGSGSLLMREQVSGSLPKGCFSFKTYLVNRSMNSSVVQESGLLI